MLKTRFFSSKVALLCIILSFQTLGLCQHGLAQKYIFKKITNSNGLSHSSVFSICQDYKGFIWFGTREGLNKYDGKLIKTYYFENRLPNVESSRINALFADEKRLLVGTSSGLFTYSFLVDQFQKIDIPTLPKLYVNSIGGQKGNLLINTQNGLVLLKKNGNHTVLLPKKNIVASLEIKEDIFLVAQPQRLSIVSAKGALIFEVSLAALQKSVRIETIYRDLDGAIWIGTSNGLFQFRLDNFTIKQPDTIQVNDYVRAIAEDTQGKLWLGTEAGVYVFDKKEQTILKIDQSYENAPDKLSDKSIYSVFVSKEGFVWLGTYFGGVNFTNPQKEPIAYLLPQSFGAKILTGKAISQIKEDTKKNIWVATEDGGINVLDKELNFKKGFSKKNGLSDDNIHSLLIEQNQVWAGSFLGGLNLILLPNGIIKTYKNTPNQSNTLSNNSVYAILRDSKNTIWVGTQSGLNIFNQETEAFSLAFPKLLADKFIYDLHEDTHQNLWIATRFDGIYRFNLNSKEIRHYSAFREVNMTSNQIISIVEDADQNMWFGTLGGGVLFFRTATQRFERQGFLCQLPSQTVYGTIEDKEKNLWFSTNKGLVKYNTKQDKVTIFDQRSGLPTIQFNFKSFLKRSDNRLLFGSINGLCHFELSALQKSRQSPVCHFSSLKLFNQEVEISKNSILKKHIDETIEVEFDNNQNVITLDFVTLNFRNNGNNYFTYYLEGFEDTWNPKSEKGTVTYTNLSAGEYVFHLKALRPDGSPSVFDKTLKIKVRPPLWFSWYAILFYLILLATIIYFYNRFVRFVNVQKLAVQVEKIEKEKSNLLNQQKLDFFTFIANEFRTPLTLITAVVDEITSSEILKKEEVLSYSKILKKNAHHLQILIKQLGIFRMTQPDPQTETVFNLDLVGFIKESLWALNPVLKPLDIRLEKYFSHPYFNAYFNSEKVEIVLNNVFFEIFSLLNNEQSVRIDTQISAINKDSQAECAISLTVNSDTPTLLNHVLFSKTSLVFELLKDLRGNLTHHTTNDIEQIIIKFPVWTQPNANLIVKSQQKPTVNSFWLEEESTAVSTIYESKKPKLLIAEKNTDFQNFLKKHYIETFDITLTTNYAKTLEKTKTLLPDLILCDERIANEQKQNLCVELKKDTRTNFVPVVLFLENDTENNRLNALTNGADLILVKPFKIKELDLLIVNTLKSQQLMKEKFVGILKNVPKEGVFTNNRSYDFLLKFKDLIKIHYKNPELSIDFLSHSLGCSRSTLHLKIKSLTGMSTIEYLHEYRLEMAFEALKNGKSVAEASFEVGFNDPNYFSRIFKRKYGKSPRQISQS